MPQDEATCANCRSWLKHPLAKPEELAACQIHSRAAGGTSTFIRPARPTTFEFLSSRHFYCNYWKAVR